MIGVGRTDWSDEDLHQHAREAIEARFEAKGAGEIDEDVFKRFTDSLSYVQGDYNEFDTYRRVKDDALGGQAPGLLSRDPPIAVRRSDPAASAAPD